MIKRYLGKEILAGLDEIECDRNARLKLRKTELSAPSAPRLVREKLQLSQAAFAGLLGVSTRTLQDWEQGRRNPQGPAIALLRIAEQHPEVFLELT